LPNSIHIRCRLLLCDWLNKTRCETSSTIKQQLDSISNSIQTLDKSSLSLIFESYLAMAYFSDNEYQRLNQLFHSPIFENKRLLITRNQIEYTKQEKLDPIGRYTKVLKRSLDMDKKEIDEQKKLQYSYLISTLNNYFICLKFFSNLTRKQQKLNNEIIPRNNSVPEIMITSKCLSYWFTNFNNDEVNKTLKKNLLQIPTHFFLPFVYQMAARMALINEKTSVFHSILLEYLSQCIIDHPHHVLPVIFALANAHKDAHINQQSTNTTKKNSTNEIIQLNNEINNDPRSRAAQYLLDKCSKDKPQLVDQMRKLNDAYIEAAYWDLTPAKTDQQGKNLIFSKQLRLMHIKDFDEVAVPTINLPVNEKESSMENCFDSFFYLDR
jgi:ataxia telangiectasia mutated family protein